MAPMVGVFDSGFGGLTVLRSLLSRIPSAQYLYLGDTARLPYGAKSQATIARYAVESARFLEQRGCDYLVIACNTATALALDDIRRAVRVPVLGVIEPGAHAANRAVANARGRGAGARNRGDRAVARLSRRLRSHRPARRRGRLPSAGSAGRGGLDGPRRDARGAAHLSLRGPDEVPSRRPCCSAARITP